MKTFGEMMEMLAKFKDLADLMTWEVSSSGMLTVTIKEYVGMENYDLYKQAQEMFKPTDPEW